ncbi:MAG: HAD-IA family hydrolase [Acidobacteria bacterium]|nr:HAD-IA family hydrolase [Acidobacteriota bacterium]MCG3192124.1 Phosphoglycolate phosphatase [Thermoanaerobaculia bacterium]MCK6683670.1 HAD-IA family hydrolase [Thermoanaerobaculia bacterium]
MPIKAIFFDAGNTLLSCDPPVEEVYAAAFASHGVSATPAAVRSALRETWRDVRNRRRQGQDTWNGFGGEKEFWRWFVSSAFSRLGGGEMPDEMFDGLVSHFQKPQHWSVFPEVPEVLETLRARGYMLLVVSNWDSNLPALLARLDLSRHFDHVVVSSLIGSSKPSPKIFEAALTRAAVAPEEALHVGDSLEEDYEGARLAGLAAFLLDRHEVNGDLPDSITSLSEIPARLTASA